MEQKVEQLLSHSGKSACQEAVAALFAGESPRGAAVKVYLKNFASFNQTFGYRQGEELLRQAAAFFCGFEEAQPYRFGGGVSFVLLLPGAGPVEATALAQRIVDRFQQPWAIGVLDCVCAVDVGAVLYPDFARTPRDLFANLDLALEQSAKDGPNQATLFGQELEEKLYRKTVIARLLGSAVAAGNIELRYRPTWSAAANAFTRVEVQPRLLTVEFGPVKSGEYGPIAEETGIVSFVNLYVLRKTCELIRLLLDDGCQVESVAAEVSPIMFVQRGFLGEVAALLEEYRIPRGKLAMETFEHPLIDHAARPVLDRLKEMGVELVLSSFDFGYAGFKDLLTLPLDALKLKRLFVWQLETNPKSGPVIDGLTQAAAKLGLKLIAEGVETEQQDALLSAYGCPYRQGFYHSPTVNLAELREILPKGG